MAPVLWLHRTAPEPWLPGSPTPFRLPLSRDVRTQIEVISPELGDSHLADTGLTSFIADKNEDWHAVLRTEASQKALHAIRDQQRTRVNDTTVRPSAGVKAQKGGLVPVRESDATLESEGVHRKLVHEE